MEEGKLQTLKRTDVPKTMRMNPLTNASELKACSVLLWNK